MPVFSILDEKEILYLVLYADYNSPYRQRPEHDRKKQAMWHAFGENAFDIIESEKMLTAITSYKALQYSPKIKAADDYQKKIDNLLDQLQGATTPADIKKIDEAIDVCRKRIRMFEQEYELDMQKQGVIQGKKELSLLEKFMSNAKQYDATIHQEIKLK